MGNETFGRETVRIVKFTPRRRDDTPLPLAYPPGAQHDTASEADDVDDYRHRMKTNLAAATVVALLIAFGLWLADQMADFRAAQECLTMGARGTCATIQVPAPNR